jgi:hypothetical protein
MYLKPDDIIEGAALMRERLRPDEEPLDNGILLLKVGYAYTRANGTRHYMRDIVHLEYQWSTATWYKTRIEARGIPAVSSDLIDIMDEYTAKPMTLMDGTQLHREMFPLGQCMRDDLPWEALPKPAVQSRIVFQRPVAGTGMFQLHHGMWEGYDHEQNKVSILAQDKPGDPSYKERNIAPGDVVCIIP